MGQGLMHRQRLSATLALIGMAFHAVLVPGHTVSPTTALAGTASAISGEPPCHNASAATNSERSKGEAVPRQLDFRARGHGGGDVPC